jgi:very-short-patch-repair endonuclease/succinate dehydrogenase flavin-adding protein (antitoxin of CptAB toxin-antitoxin module)
VSRIDPRLGGFAREMRNEPVEAEARLWGRLRASQLGGFKFRRQAVVEPYIADFLCPAVGLMVELDGPTHDAEADVRRDKAMTTKGFAVLRFWNDEIYRNLDGVLVTILAAAEARPARWAAILTPPLKRRGKMTLDFRRRRARFRAWHRGTREADLMIGGFSDRYVETWDADQLGWFEALLEEIDVDVMAWAIGTQPAPARYHGPQLDALLKLDYVSKVMR